MSRYYGGWARYVPVAERRRKAEAKLAKLRKSGPPVQPVTIIGRKIATTFWGQAWCDNLESYGDYESRLPRGRTYVRNGSVLDLQIAQGQITAMVSGSELYTVGITIKEAAKTHWRAICTDCAGSIDSLVELLQGRLSKQVMERLCRQENGLFPRPAEIRFTCSCPDHASMCKHVAAVLYGVGARLDQRPELLFRLRAVDEAELIATVDTTTPLSKTAPDAARMLETDDVASLFGIDMAAGPAQAAAKGKKRATAPAKSVPSTMKKRATKKVAIATGFASPDVSSGRKLSAKSTKIASAEPIFEQANLARKSKPKQQKANPQPRIAAQPKSKPKPVKWW
jgi:uncharacterized Zn finger protein